MIGLDDHIEGRYDSNNPANMMECPHCEDALITPYDETCWKCHKSVNIYYHDRDSEGRETRGCKK